MTSLARPSLLCSSTADPHTLGTSSHLSSWLSPTPYRPSTMLELSVNPSFSQPLEKEPTKLNMDVAEEGAPAGCLVVFQGKDVNGRDKCWMRVSRGVWTLDSLVALVRKKALAPDADSVQLRRAGMEGETKEIVLEDDADVLAFNYRISLSQASATHTVRFALVSSCASPSPPLSSSRTRDGTARDFIKTADLSTERTLDDILAETHEVRPEDEARESEDASQAEPSRPTIYTSLVVEKPQRSNLPTRVKSSSNFTFSRPPATIQSQTSSSLSSPPKRTQPLPSSSMPSSQIGQLHSTSTSKHHALCDSLRFRPPAPPPSASSFSRHSLPASSSRFSSQSQHPPFGQQISSSFKSSRPPAVPKQPPNPSSSRLPTAPSTRAPPAFPPPRPPKRPRPPDPDEAAEAGWSRILKRTASGRGGGEVGQGERRKSWFKSRKDGRVSSLARADAQLKVKVEEGDEEALIIKDG